MAYKVNKTVERYSSGQMVQFLIVGFDGKDRKAPERRAKARPYHIAMGDKLLKAGNLWYGAAIIDDAGAMRGSIYMVDFPSERKLKEYLAREPYVKGKVWKKMEIIKCRTRDPWQFNRPKSFFKERMKV